MAIHFGWFGSRGQGGVVHQDLEQDMEGTAIDVYMSYGLRTLPTMQDYFDKVDEVLDDVISDSPIKLILEVSLLALDDLKTSLTNTTKIEDIRDAYDSDSRVWGYFIEEPNWPEYGYSKFVTDVVRDTMNKPVIVDVRTAGAQDASDPTDEDEANQATYSDYAANCDIICGFDYPFTWSGTGWQYANEFTTSDEPLHYLENHTPTSVPAWFAVQAFEQENEHHLPSTAQMEWLTYRALASDMRGILFYSFLLSTEDMIDDVKSLCSTIKNKDLHEFMDNPNIDSDAVKTTGSNIRWAFRRYTDPNYLDDSFLLLVVDDKPETAGTRTFNFECDLGDRYSDFAYVSNWLDAPTTPIASTSAGDTKITFSSNQTLSPGEYRVYRFLCP